MGYGADALDRVGDVDVVVSGNIGPGGDGYNPSELLTPEVAETHGVALHLRAVGGAPQAMVVQHADNM